MKPVPRLAAARSLLLSPVLVSVHLAAQAAERTQAPAGSSAVSFFGLLQVLFALAVVMAAIGALAWLMRRYVPGGSAASGLIKVIGGVMVGPKERVVLVEVGETWLVVGVAAGQVTLLHTMGRLSSGLEARREAGAHVSFPAWLQKALRGQRQEH